MFKGVVDLLKKKTGDTGHYVLKIGVVATLFSKELIVFNEEVNEYFLLLILVIFIVSFPPSLPPFLLPFLQVLVGGSLLTVIYFLYKKFGPVATEFFDKRTQVTTICVFSLFLFNRQY